MSELDQHSRTEAPTPRRREQARDRGDVASSTELTGGLALLAAMITLWLAGDFVGAEIKDCLRGQLSRLRVMDWTIPHTVHLGSYLARKLLLATGLLLAVLCSTHLLVSGALGGFRVTLQPLLPDVSRLSPTHGWSRLWSSASTVKALLALVKTGVILCVLLWVCWRASAEVSMAGTDGLRAALSLGWLLAIRLGFVVSGALICAGLADYGFQRWRFENKLRMSREELKQERKEDEGDPHMRARARKMQREMSKNQMLRDVSTATVVLTNPTHLAVAIAYDRATMTAPQVVAKGSDALAKRIVAIANKHDVPVLERKPLAQALYHTVAVGQEIPAHLYHALVEILTYLYQLGKFS